MQVFTCLWNLTMLGSTDLLLIDSYGTLNQGHACSNSRSWRNLFWKQKSWQLSFAQPPPMPHIYMRIVSMIPLSYLVHFELVQTHCLISMLCTFRTLAIHVHGVNHCPSWSIIQKLIIPLKQKGKQVKWVIILMDSCSKKKRGEDDKIKNIDDG